MAVEFCSKENFIIMPLFWIRSLFVWVLVIRLSWARCVHDDMPLADQAAGIFVHDGNEVHADSGWHRDRRNARPSKHSEDAYQPLRVHVVHVNSQLLSRDTQHMVKKAVQQAVLRIQSALSVIPVRGPLLLPRTACSTVLSGGINKGRCTRIQKGYSGEVCLDILKIPDRHLGGLWLYDGSRPEPAREVVGPGPGVDNSDVVLYVVATDAQHCALKDGSVVAFASSCRVDKSTGRPTAGLVNFCPYALTRQNVTQDLLYTTALHEIIHVLGFSTKLFGTFLDCRGEQCDTRKKWEYIRKVGGRDKLIHKLILPTVVRQTRQHFGCHSDPYFGGLLETRNSEATSHWDSLMMHTSLMTAEVQNVSYPVLDPITLAVLEDSQWYKVTFSSADTFLWGKDAGCWFGSVHHCQQYTDYFCSDNSSGCHFLLRDKAVCDAFKLKKHCGVYARIPQGSCRQNMAESREDSVEIFSPSSRCFVSSITRATAQDGGEEFGGQCYDQRCTGNGTVLVRLQGTGWIPCPPGQTIQISGLRGRVQCPNNTDILCLDDSVMPSAPISPRRQGTSSSTIKSTVTATPVPHQPTYSVKRSATDSTAVFCIDSCLVAFIFCVHVRLVFV